MWCSNNSEQYNAEDSSSISYRSRADCRGDDCAGHDVHKNTLRVNQFESGIADDFGGG